MTCVESSSRKRRTSEPVDEATASAKKRLKTEELGDGESAASRATLADPV